MRFETELVCATREVDTVLFLYFYSPRQYNFGDHFFYFYEEQFGKSIWAITLIPKVLAWKRTGMFYSVNISYCQPSKHTTLNSNVLRKKIVEKCN